MKKILVFMVMLVLFVGEVYSAKKIVVGVSEFENITKDKTFDWLSNGIPDSLTTDLAEVKSISVIESREKVTDALKKFITISDVKLGEIIGANILVVGSFQAIGEQIRIDARCVNVETGQVMASQRFQGKTEKVLDLYPQIALTLAKKLGVEVTPSEKREIEKPETPHFKAYKYYALAKRTRYYEEKKIAKAKKYVKKAIKVDPEYEKAKRLLEEIKLFEELTFNDKIADLTFEQQRIRGETNPHYEINTGVKSEEIDFPVNLYKLGGRWLLNGERVVRKGRSAGLGTYLIGVSKSGNIRDWGGGLEFQFFYWLAHWRRLVIFPGIGLDWLSIWFKQKYAYPPDKKWTWQIGNKEYEIPKSGTAYSGADFLGTKFFVGLGCIITKNISLTFEIGHKKATASIESFWEKDFNGDGQIDAKTERVPIPTEWLQYRDFQIGGSYFNASIKFGFK